MDWMDIVLWIGYALLFIAAGASIVMPLINAASNPSVLVKSGIGVAALIVVFLLGYLISGSEVTELYATRNITPGLSKAAGGALISFYILLLLAGLGIAYTELSKFFK